MAFGSDRAANFVIAAKDAATGPIGNIGKAMGSLKSSAGAAFKAIAAGAVVGATALAAFTATAIKGAMSEEKSIILTNAALRQRGFDLDALGPKVEAQVKAFERFGLEGENVRAGIEAGSRFFKNQENLLKANAVAANIAAVTDQDLATVMTILGKAAMGQTRGLKTLGIEVEEGAKLKDILAAADEKYAGIADELANSTSGKMLAAQEKFNGAMDEFGFKFLPAVSEAMTFLTTNVLPIAEELFGNLGDVLTGIGTKMTEKGGVIDSFFAAAAPIGEKLSPKVQELADNVGELLGKVADLVVALWDEGDGPLALAVSGITGFFDALLGAINGVIEVITFLIELATKALKILDDLGGKARGQAAFPTFTGGGGAYGGSPMTGGTSPYPTGPIGATINIGTQTMNTIDLKLGGQANASTGRFIPGID